MTGLALAKYLGVDRSTPNKWGKQGCPCRKLGSVGRGHAHEFDWEEVQRWLVQQRIPMVARQTKQDTLKVMATAIYDALKRDGLMGKTLPAEHTALLIFERYFRNVTKRPLEAKDVPEEMRHVCSNFVDSIERGKFQR